MVFTKIEVFEGEEFGVESVDKMMCLVWDVFRLGHLQGI